jgi:hypothetical protein
MGEKQVFYVYHYVAAQSSFMTVYVEDVHTHVQRLVSVVKIATMLEGVLLKSSILLCIFFLWTKGLYAKDIHREMFPVYSGKCLLCNAVHN